MNENLIPTNLRSKEEVRRNASKGGIKSGQVRREKKIFQEAVLKALSAKENGETVLDRGVIALCKRMLKGDPKAFELLRDTAGEKPTDKVEASVTSENKELMREYLASLKKEG